MRAYVSDPTMQMEVRRKRCSRARALNRAEDMPGAIRYGVGRFGQRRELAALATLPENDDDPAVLERCRGRRRSCAEKP